MTRVFSIPDCGSCPKTDCGGRRKDPAGGQDPGGADGSGRVDGPGESRGFIVEIIRGDQRRVCFAEEGDNLLQLIRQHFPSFSAPCGGRGLCGKCGVRIMDASGTFERLSCRTEIRGDMAVVLPEDEGGIRTVTAGTDRVFDALRDGEGKTDLENDFAKAGCGAAIDLGTTTLCFALVDLRDGRVLNSFSKENPQRSFGADVLTRIGAAGRGHAGELREIIIKSLVSGIETLLDKVPGARGHLLRISVAGNTTMIHLLLGEDVSHMGEYPFDPGDISMRHIVFDDTDTYIMPGISAFVGGDIVSGMYAMGMADDQDKTTLLIDLGTNGEMVIGNGREFLATSTAAGPAFEAVGISCGMAGVTGAISDIRLMPLGSGGRVVVTRSVIRDEKGVMPSPRGVCGSGLIAAVSELVRLGLLDKSGAYTTEKLRRDGFMLYQGSGYEKNIILTQDDVRTLLVAKAAVSAGIRILVEEWMSGIGHKSPEAVYLAGGFGDGLDLNAAVGIGLIPVEWKDITKPMGNTSLWGAEKLLRALMDGRDDELRKPGDIVSKTRVINLAEDKDFNSIYLEEMCYE